LLERVLDVARAGGEVSDGVVGKLRVVLDLEDAGFGEVLQNFRDGGDFGRAGFLGCSLKRSVSHEFLWERFGESVTGESASVKAKSGESEQTAVAGRTE
jgi:hypothetical protein